MWPADCPHVSSCNAKETNLYVWPFFFEMLYVLLLKKKCSMFCLSDEDGKPKSRCHWYFHDCCAIQESYITGTTKVSKKSFAMNLHAAVQSNWRQQCQASGFSSFRWHICRMTGQQQQASIGSYVLHLLLLGQIGVKKKMTADEPSIVLRQEHMTFRKKPKKNLTSIFRIRNSDFVIKVQLVLRHN